MGCVRCWCSVRPSPQTPPLREGRTSVSLTSGLRRPLGWSAGPNSTSRVNCSTWPFGEKTGCARRQAGRREHMGGMETCKRGRCPPACLGTAAHRPWGSLRAAWQESRHVTVGRLWSWSWPPRPSASRRGPGESRPCSWAPLLAWGCVAVSPGPLAVSIPLTCGSSRWWTFSTCVASLCNPAAATLEAGCPGSP